MVRRTRVLHCIGSLALISGAADPASAGEPEIDLATLILTPGFQIGSDSVAGGTNWLSLGVNLQFGPLNVFVDGKVGGPTDRVTSIDGGAPYSDRTYGDAFIGWVVADNGTDSDFGLMLFRSYSSYTWRAVTPLEIEVTERSVTTIKNRRGYADVPTLEQYIAEVGVISEIMGTTPELSRAVFPAAGIRFHRHFDVRGDVDGEEERVRSQIVYTFHAVGPYTQAGGDVPDPERDGEGFSNFGFVASAEIQPFKVANIVARVGTLPNFADYFFSVGMKFPYWLF